MRALVVTFVMLIALAPLQAANKKSHSSHHGSKGTKSGKLKKQNQHHAKVTHGSKTHKS
jgi:hypothetical protein